MHLDVDSDGMGDLSDFADLSDEDCDDDWDAPASADYRFTVAPATRKPATTPAPPVHVPLITPVAAPPPPCVG
jgi:hypothetical protein